VQIGTASFTDPTAAGRLLEQLPTALTEAGASTVADLVGTLQLPGT
jgi:dihydroorotate dehydrogenase